jgi:regulator of protease activity HflC (stomatin/prohibitin superfamily)
MQDSMERQAAADRERKATVTKAEGDKQAAILEAEARFEAAKRDAAAQVALAQGAAEAIRKITEAIPDREFPAYYLLGEKYIHAMEKLASSSNSKTVVLPADIMQTVQNMLGKK